MEEFIRESTGRVEERTRFIVRCLEELNEEEIWRKPNSSSNSVGNLILHLCGNVRQYAIASLGHRPDVREREKEFSAAGGLSKAELLALLRSTVDEALRTIHEATASELLDVRVVQGNHRSGIGIIVQVTEHFSYHAGQIAFWTKFLRNRDLGLYAGRNLNARNEP